MSEWKEVRLGDVVEIRRGSSPRPIKDYLTNNGGMPWIKIADATESKSRFIEKTNEFIKHEGVCNSVIVNEGDLILSNSGTAGLPKFIKFTACIHDGWQVFQSYNGIDKLFLYYYLLFIRAKLLHNAYDSTMKNLTLDMLRDYSVFLPPLETQKKIATVLSNIDEKIELNNKINKDLEDMAQAIFKSWFVDFEPFGGVIPDEWREGKAEDFFDISIGKTPPRKESKWFSLDKSNIVWVSISDMGNCGTYISSSSEFLTQESIEKFNIKVVPKNTVLLSFKLTVGRVAITTTNMTTNEAIAHFVSKHTFGIEYLYLFLRNFKFETMGSTSSIATAVNSKIIKAMKIIMPCEILLQDFHKTVSPLFEEIKTLQAENQRLSQLRDTLLPRLMSGEIDVSSVED